LGRPFFSSSLKESSNVTNVTGCNLAGVPALASGEIRGRADAHSERHLIVTNVTTDVVTTPGDDPHPRV